MNNEPVRTLELFGGILATSEALNRLGVEHVTTSIEFDKKVLEVSNALNQRNDTVQNVRDFHANKGDYDLLIAGFPCPPFSFGGKNKGFDDPRGDLFKEVLRLIREIEPTYLILENVKGILQEKHKWIIVEIEQELINLGYNISTSLVNGIHFIPQQRERVFILGSKKAIINLELPTKKGNLGDYIDWLYDDKYLVTQPSMLSAIENKKVKVLFPHTKNINTLTTKNVRWNNEGVIELIAFLQKYRYLKPNERMRLMGWNDEQIDRIKHISDAKVNFTSGNSMIIPVMEYNLRRLGYGD